VNANAAAESFFAICPRGLETLLGEELAAVGARDVGIEAGGVSFSGTLPIAYAANLHSRLASRILWQIAQAPYHDEATLYAAATAVNWHEYFANEQTLRVDVTASRTPLRSLEFATLKIKDAIVDRLRTDTGGRPSIDRAQPDVRVFAYLDATTVTLYLDLSGEPLFKRGWRRDKGEAPLKENLAAGLLRLANWSPERPLFDPMCGSGTIAIEAALLAIARAPGLDRSFGFERLRSFDEAAWRSVRARALAAQRPETVCCIVGTDISTRVIEQARRNAGLAGLAALLADGRLQFAARDVRLSEPPVPASTGADANARGQIISNPPYGEQSSPKSASVPNLMRDFADRMKLLFAGWEAWLLSADRDLPRQMRLQETRKTVLFNGPLECRFFRFELVAGKYRARSGTHETKPAD